MCVRSMKMTIFTVFKKIKCKNQDMNEDVN